MQVVGENIEASEAVKDILTIAEEKATQASATKVTGALHSLTALQSLPPCISASAFSFALAPSQLFSLLYTDSHKADDDPLLGRGTCALQLQVTML